MCSTTLNEAIVVTSHVLSAIVQQAVSIRLSRTRRPKLSKPVRTQDALWASILEGVDDGNSSFSAHVRALRACLQE